MVVLLLLVACLVVFAGLVLAETEPTRHPATVAVWAGPIVVAVQNVHLAERWSARLWRCLRRDPLDGLSLINRTDITFPSLPECIITHLTVDCQGTHSVLPIDAS